MDRIDNALKVVLDADVYADLEKICNIYQKDKKDFLNTILRPTFWEVIDRTNKKGGG